MNSKTLNKQSLVNHLEHEGFTVSDAEKAVSALLEYMRANLEKGNSVNLPRIGKITPFCKKAGKEVLFGKMVDTKERIKLKITASQTLSEAYQDRMDSKETSDTIRGLLG